MRNIIFAFFMTVCWKASAVCSFNGGQWQNDGNFDVWVNTSAIMNSNQTTFIDLSNEIICWHIGEKPSGGGGVVAGIGDLNKYTLHDAYVSSHFDGHDVTSTYNNKLPLVNANEFITLLGGSGDLDGVGVGKAKIKVKLSLTPKKNASGIAINSGDKIGFVRFSRIKHFGQPLYYFNVNIYSRNSIIIPAGGCDVNSRSINVALGDYPSDTTPRSINLRVRCPGAPGANVVFSLSGRTDAPTIFSNVATNSPASGIGVQILRNGAPIPANTNVSIGTVDASGKDIGISASYVLNGGALKTGNVQSVIGVNFTYN